MTMGKSTVPEKDSNVVRLIARLAWFFPVVLVLLAANQAFVAFQLVDTLNNGVYATAEVLEYERVDRADVTFGYVSLAVVMTDGTRLVKEKMSLPYTLLPMLEGETELQVVVMEGSKQEIVIASIAGTQWKIAAIQSSKIGRAHV